VSVGRRLCAARAARGLTLEDVSRATRIRVPVLVALETDDFAVLGAAVYARGHIRSVAGLLEVDPAPLLAEYDKRHARTPSRAAQLPTRDRAVTLADRRTPRWLGAAVVTVAVLAGLTVVGTVVEQRVDSVVVAAGPVPTSTTPDAQADPAPPPADVEGETPPPETGVDPGPKDLHEEEPGAAPGTPGSGSDTEYDVRVALRSGRSWVEVTDANGGRVFAGMLEAGATEEFEGSSGFRLTLGNAPAVRLEVDGRAVPLPGEPGEVVKVQLRPAGGVSVE